MTLPSGRQAAFGVDESGAQAALHVKRYSALWSLARRGALGFAEDGKTVYLTGSTSLYRLHSKIAGEIPMYYRK